MVRPILEFGVETGVRKNRAISTDLAAVSAHGLAQKVDHYAVMRHAEKPLYVLRDRGRRFRL